MTYDNQLQAYVFNNTNALVPAKNSIYIIYTEATRRNFRYNPEIKQFRQMKAKHCDWTTRYLFCQDVIFNHMTDQTNYVKQGSNEQMLGKQHSVLQFQATDHDKSIG